MIPISFQVSICVYLLLALRMATAAVGLAVGPAHRPEDHATDTLLGKDGGSSPHTEVI